MKVKLIIISIILLLVMVFASGCIPVMEKLGLVSPTDEEQLSPEKASSDGLVKVLIGFKEKPGAAQQVMVRGVGGKIKYTYHIVDAIAASIPEKAIDALQKNPNVTHVELDGEVFAIGETLPWGVDRIDAEVVHASNTGAGVNVAILDTGIDESHPDLCVAGGENFSPGKKSYDDGNGHGTHVAGIVAALDNDIGVIGVAPDVNLFAVKVLGDRGIGRWSDLIAGLQWCVDNEMEVANMSLGATSAPSDVLDACDAADKSGVLLVAAAGNESGGPVIYPAAYPSVIAVSATDEGDNLADFSSTGVEVELAAPGVDIYSTYKDDGYAIYSGTSMASPHVAGVAALVINAGILNVRSQLQSTAENIELLTTEQGYGLVNAAEAASEPVDVHDVAVTAILAPSPVYQGDKVSVNVDVANEGMFDETFNVVLTGENPDGFTDTKAITLAAGASTTISFLWQTSELTTLGDHTLTATADPVTGETDTADNSRSTIVTVKEAVANIMYVETIIFSSKVAGPNKFLYTTVKVVDGYKQPLGGVRVEMTLTHDLSSSWNFTGDTASDGTVKFTLNKAPSGYYTATVTNLILTDYGRNTTQGVTDASCELKDDGTFSQDI